MRSSRSGVNLSSTPFTAGPAINFRLGNGDGTYQAAVNYAAGMNPTATKVATSSANCGAQAAFSAMNCGKKAAAKISSLGLLMPTRKPPRNADPGDDPGEGREDAQYDLLARPLAQAEPA